jgi:hypothetical protein
MRKMASASDLLKAMQEPEEPRDRNFFQNMESDSDDWEKEDEKEQQKL